MEAPVLQAGLLLLAGVGREHPAEIRRRLGGAVLGEEQGLVARVELGVVFHRRIGRGMLQ